MNIHKVLSESVNKPPTCLFHVYSEACLVRPLLWVTTCMERPQTPGRTCRRFYISVQLILSQETTSHERPYFYGQCGCLSIKCLLFNYWNETPSDTYRGIWSTTTHLSTVKPFLGDHCHERPSVLRTTSSWQNFWFQIFSTIEPVTKDYLSWETILLWLMGRSFKTGSTVY